VTPESGTQVELTQMLSIWQSVFVRHADPFEAPGIGSPSAGTPLPQPWAAPHPQMAPEQTTAINPRDAFH
jgi:hypothetical protein